MEYEQLLKRARERLPAAVVERERFEIPKVKGHLEGNKTVISNFTQIASALRRPAEHLLKFILKELATPGDVNRAGLLVLGSRVPASRVNEKIREYAYEFVLCPQDGKPDTDIIYEGEFAYLKCNACGYKQPVKSKI
jgi:translation initiation factor 2 subunit 2